MQLQINAIGVYKIDELKVNLFVIHNGGVPRAPKSEVLKLEETRPKKRVRHHLTKPLSSAEIASFDHESLFTLENRQKAYEYVRGRLIYLYGPAAAEQLVASAATILKNQPSLKILPKELPPAYPTLQPTQETIAAEPVEQESFFIQNGMQYMPLADAARLTGVHRETLLNWTKAKVEIDGEPIDALYFKPTGNHFISKLSVERIAKRFVNPFMKWPSGEAAEPVSIGQTEHQSGYLPTSDAARIIGIPDPTLRHWVRLNTAPLDKALDVIKSTTSGRFYIQHRDVLRLAQHVKTHGLPRGRRAQASPSLPA